MPSEAVPLQLTRIQALEDVLRQLKDEKPELVASLQGELGNALATSSMGSSRAYNLEQAIQAYQAALEIRTRNDFPEQWAMTQHNLGNAYGKRIRGAQAENLERALEAYEAALTIYTRDAFPEDWAMTQHSLGNAYRDRIRSAGAENLERALEAYGEAARIYTTDTNPEAARQVRLGQSAALLKAGRWQAALDASEEGLAASRILFDISLHDPEVREREIGTSEMLYAHCAFAQAQLGRPDKALAILEEGRARELRYRAGRDRADLEDLPEQRRAAFLQAAQRVRDLEAEWRRPEEERPADLADKTRQARQGLEQEAQQIRVLKPNFLRASVDLHDIRAVLPGQDAALVEFAVTEAGTLALVLPAGQGALKRSGWRA